MIQIKNWLKKLYQVIVKSSYDGSETSDTAIGVSVVLHIILFLVVIIFLVESSPKRQPQTIVQVTNNQKPIVNAQVISSKAVENEVKRLDDIKREKEQAEINRQNELLRQKRLAEQKRKQALAEAKLAKEKAEKAHLERLKEEKRLADLKKKQQQEKLKKQKQAQEKAKQLAEEKERQKQLEALKNLGLSGLDQQINQAAIDQKQKEQQAQAQQQRLSESEKYQALIRQVVQSNWIDPQSLSQEKVVWLKISLDQNGEVKSVSVSKSSGNGVFDRQAVMAVRKSSPLPLPKDEKLKQEFQNITMSFGGNS